jgi:NhaP-type Na+/H+ and K+/H+ antiporter
VAYLRVALSGVAAIFVAELAPYFLIFLSVRGLSGTGEQGAVGFDPYSLRAGIVSPWCWLIAVVSFALFFLASRLSSKVLRVLLFWTPALAISTLGFSICALLTCAWMLLRKG